MVLMKMNVFSICAISFIIACLCLSCKNGEKKKDSETSEMLSMEYNYVDTMVLHKGEFQKQLICNGRLRAIAKSELSMPSAGYVTHIYVKTGSAVTKGQILAKTDATTAQMAVEKAEEEVEKTRIDLQDKLIGLGYDVNDNVPTDVLRRAEMSSGYSAAKIQLKEAKKSLDDCNIYAPFSGRIADLDYKPYQKSDKFCTLIDDSWFDIEFSVLEAELSSVSRGQKVKVSPFVDESKILEGTITEINPTVSDKGLIKVRARIENKSDGLIEGMNVKVIAERKVENMFVVPKDAVVERDGYHVVFLYCEGKAIWTYVDVVYSNLNSYAITGSEKKETTIKEGDIVITSGNLNLADDTSVKPRKSSDDMIGN